MHTVSEILVLALQIWWSQSALHAVQQTTGFSSHGLECQDCPAHRKKYKPETPSELLHNPFYCQSTLSLLLDYCQSTSTVGLLSVYCLSTASLL